MRIRPLALRRLTRRRDSGRARASHRHRAAQVSRRHRNQEAHHDQPRNNNAQISKRREADSAEVSTRLPHGPESIRPLAPVRLNIDQKRRLPDQPVHREAARHNRPRDAVRDEEEVNGALLAARSLADAQSLTPFRFLASSPFLAVAASRRRAHRVTRVARPLGGEAEAIEDVAVKDIQDAEDGVRGVGESNGAQEICIAGAGALVMWAAKEEAGVDAAKTKG